MKLSADFLIHNTGDEQILVSTGNTAFHGLVHSNRTAACIVDALKTETTEQEIIRNMLERFDAPEDVIASDVARILATLRSIGALDESTPKETNENK